MKTILDFNCIKNTIIELAETHGISRQQLIDCWNEETEALDWSINYRNDLQKEFECDAEKLQAAINLYHAAIKNNDLLTAECALLDAGIWAHNLTNFFENIKDDLKKALIEKQQFNWPEIPEGYQIPKHYNYKN